MTGKAVRLTRIFNSLSGRTIIAPLDHGVSMGPITGLGDMSKILHDVSKGGANAAVLHRGSIPRRFWEDGGSMGLIVHLSGSTNLSPDPLRKVEVCSVEDAVCMGADAVSIHINFGNSFEGEMLRDLGEVSGQCHRWGVPLMVMAYVRGP